MITVLPRSAGPALRIGPGSSRISAFATSKPAPITSVIHCMQIPSILKTGCGTSIPPANRHGVKVASLYSGHGTYATVGLASPDRRNQARIQNQWLEVMIRNAVRLRAGLGFYCHAFNEDILQDPSAYASAEEELCRRLGKIAEYASAHDLNFIAVEQMYSPHQIPWTIPGAGRFLKGIWARSRCPIYLTLDTGHQYGQRKFVRLTSDQVRQSLRQARLTGRLPMGVWLAGLCLRAFPLGDYRPRKRRRRVPPANRPGDGPLPLSLRGL